LHLEREFDIVFVSVKMAYELTFLYLMGPEVQQARHRAFLSLQIKYSHRRQQTSGDPGPGYKGVFL